MDPRTKRILIAEDEKPLAHALEVKLRSAGYDAQVVSEGVEALSSLATSHFDLLLLDLIMPNKDGFAVLTELMNKQNQIPIIVMTNLSQEEDYKRAKSLGAWDYYVKTDITLGGLVEKVAGAITDLEARRQT